MCIRDRSINFKYVKFSSWIFAALAGVLSGNLISSSVSKLSRASARNVDVTAPAWMRGQVEILGTAFPKTRLMIIIITLISVIAITLFLNQSAWGMRIRAVTQNREMSDCLGISTEKVDVLLLELVLDWQELQELLYLYWGRLDLMLEGII